MTATPGSTPDRTSFWEGIAVYFKPNFGLAAYQRRVDIERRVCR